MDVENASSQQLVFAPGFEEDSYKLLELPPSVADALLAGGELRIKGAQDDEAVLCTANETFLVRKAESSNTQLLLPSRHDPASGNCHVLGSVTHHLELLPVAPRLSRLDDLLGECPLRERDEGELNGVSGGSKKRGYTFAELSERVQSSEAELKLGLERAQAFELDGVWRVLHPGYLERVFDFVLALIVKEDWDLDRIPGHAVVKESAETFPSVAVLQALRIHAVGGTAAPSEDGGMVWELDPVAVSTFRALQILRASPNAWVPYEEFEQRWTCSLPRGAVADAALLRGLALRSNEAPGARLAVRFFPEAELPTDPAARFHRLFAAQQRWTLEDMEPYIKQLVEHGAGQTQGALLKRFSRTSRVAGSDLLYLTKR